MAVRRVASALGLVVPLVFVGCGGGSRLPVSSSDGSPPLAGALGAVDAAGSERGGVVVRSSDDGDGPKTIVIDLGTGKQVSLPTPHPLYGVATWAAHDTIGVVGVPCERWATGSAPRWEDDRLTNVSDACGRRAGVWIVDRATMQVVELQVEGLTSSNGFHVVDVRGGSVLLLASGVDEASLLLLRVDEARVEVVPAPMSTGGSAEAQEVTCLDAGGEPFNVIMWQGEPPSGVAPLGPYRLDSADSASGAVAFTVTRGAWSPVRIEGDAASLAGVRGCGPEGVWVLDHDGGAVIERSGGTANVQNLPPAPPLGEGQRRTVHPLRGGGGPVIIDAPMDATAPDGEQRGTAHILVQGHWNVVSSAPMGSSSSPFVNGARISAFRYRPLDPQRVVDR